MQARFQRTQFTWLAYILLAFYGYFLNIYGPITPFLKDDLKLTYTVSSLHFTAFAFGIIIVGFFGHLVIERLGRLRSLWAASFGISLSAFLLLLGQTPLVTIAASFLMGVIGSLILAVVPAALSDQFGDMRAVAISEANVISSLVSAIAPILVGWFAGSLGSWKYALAIAAIVPIILIIFFGRVQAPLNAAESAPQKGTVGPLPVQYWVLWAALVLAVSIEFCMIYWSADFLEHILGISKASAALAISLFLGAMIIGRLAGSRLVQKFAAQKVVLASTGIAAIGFG